MSSERSVVSIVIPLFNEAEVILRLLDSLERAAKARSRNEWELVLVDDGSTDDTCELVRAHRRRFHGPVRLLKLSRNFGHQPALLAGLRSARGDAVICMDADLQDPPELLPSFVDKFHEGYDVVCGVRRRRAGGWLNSVLYRLFYRLFSAVAATPVALDAGDFALMSRRVVRLLAQSQERDLFLRGLRSCGETGWRSPSSAARSSASVACFRFERPRSRRWPRVAAPSASSRSAHGASQLAGTPST